MVLVPAGMSRSVDAITMRRRCCQTAWSVHNVSDHLTVEERRRWRRGRRCRLQPYGAAHLCQRCAAVDDRSQLASEQSIDGRASKPASRRRTLNACIRLTEIQRSLYTHFRRLHDRRRCIDRFAALWHERLEPFVSTIDALRQFRPVLLHPAKVEAQTTPLTRDISSEDPVVLRKQ
jgi:hypothetical protein